MDKGRRSVGVTPRRKDYPMGYESVIASDDLVVRADTGGVAVLALNAAKSINALSEVMLAALSDSFDSIAKDRSVKAAILRSGGTHFCASHNLKEMTAQIHGHGRRKWGEVADPCKRLASALARHGTASARVTPLR